MRGGLSHFAEASRGVKKMTGSWWKSSLRSRRVGAQLYRRSRSAPVAGALRNPAEPVLVSVRVNRRRCVQARMRR